MARSQIETLVEALQVSLKTVEAKDGLVTFLGSKVDAAADRFIEDVLALRSRLGDEQLSPKDRWELFEPELLVVDLAILRVSELAEEWRRAEKDQRWLCWQDTEHQEAGHQSVQMLLVTLANAMVAARLLVLRNLFVPARTLVRSFAETADLTIAVLLDEQVLRAYLDPTEDFDRIYSIWRSCLSPARLKVVIERFWNEIEMPEDLQRELQNFAKHDQRWLSLAAHSYRVALAIGMAAHDVTRVVRDDADVELEISVDGGTATLIKLADLSAHFLQLFTRVLSDRFSWKGNRENHDQKWSYLREAVMRDLWLSYLCDAEDEEQDDALEEDE